MAALMRHGASLTGLKVVIKWAQTAGMGKKYKVRLPRKPKKLPKPGPSFDSEMQSIAHRGFLRPYKGYSPAETIEEDICSISTKVFGSSNISTNLDEPRQRFEFLHACWKHTGHAVPNSLLYCMKSVGDVIDFYKTPVNTNTPLEMMKQKELPPNLHVLYEYKRFNQDPNNMFGGESAFPESNTIITGLRARKKYKNMQAKPPLHDWLRLANWPYPPPK